MRESTTEEARTANTVGGLETGVIGDPTIDDPDGVSKALAHRDVQTALTVVQQSSLLDDEEIGKAFRLAKSLAQSGLYKGANDEALTATQAFAKILIGRDLGISPTRALASIDIVKGQAQLRGVLLAAFIRESDHYDYEILEHDEEHATVEFFGISKRTGEWKSLGTTTFTVAQAKAKNLWKAKGQWDNWPENMCIWRCISNGVKFWMGDLLKGIPVYTEADSFDTHGRDTGVGDGTGSGDGPGWQGMDAKQISLVEALIERAKRLGHMGIANKESVQVRLGLKTPPEIEAYIKEGTAILDGMEAEQEAARVKDKAIVEGSATDITADEPSRTATIHTAADLVKDKNISLDLGHMHVVDIPARNKRALHHDHPECDSRYEVPLDSGTVPVEGEVIGCLECGANVPLGTHTMDPSPAPEVDPDALDREALELMAKSDALVDTDPEQSTLLAVRAEELHEQAMALRPPSSDPDTLPGM
jgi:hypothetical protein